MAKIHSLVTAFFIVFILASCQSNKNETVEEQTETTNTWEFSKEDLKTLDQAEFVIDVKAKPTIAQWSKYNEAVQLVEDIKSGNLSFFMENHELVEALVKDLKENLPEAIATPAVKARLLVFETQLFKLESELNLDTANRDSVLKTAKKTLLAFNNITLQINKKYEKESQQIEMNDAE